MLELCVLTILELNWNQRLGKFEEFVIICSRNLVPRSHSVTGNVRSGKVRFRACSVPARPEIRAFLSVRMFVLSVVILGDFAE